MANPYEANIERRRRELEAQAAMLRKGGLTPEQMAVLVEQSGYDGSDRQDMMADLMRTGQAALIGGEIPQGRQMGNIYAGPSWSEALNAAAQRALGGYQMGQARREGREIDKRQEAALTAKQGIANEKSRIEQLQSVQKQQDAMLRQGQQDAMARERMDRQDQRAAAQEAQRNSRLTRTLAAQESRAKDKAAGSKPQGDDIDSVSRRRLKQEASVFGRLDSAVGEAKALQEKGMEIGRPIADYAAEKIKDAPLIGGESAANYVMRKAYSPEELDVVGKIDNAVEQYRRAFTGANLTLIEKLLGKNWDPSAEGLTTDQKIKRAENLMGVLNENRDAFDLSPLERKGSTTKDPEDMTEEELAAELGL